jgi:xanthine/CO dehydrogenase XdhC/CoxF family maturation factor
LLLFGQLKKAWEQGIPVASGVIIQGSPNLLGKEIIFDRNGKKIAGFSFIHTTGFQALVKKALDRSCPQREILQFTTPLNGSSISGESINAEIEVFVDVITPRPTLVIVGGVHIAVHLVSLAKILGYRTVLVDPRSKFGSPERFPNVDLLINSWPQDAFSDFSLTSTTAVAILTHDPKIDDRALEVVLPSPVFYIGALGSKKTQRQRCQRLLDSGFSISQVNKIRGPIGLNLGGCSPEEIALSIMSEITKVKNHN